MARKRAKKWNICVAITILNANNQVANNRHARAIKELTQENISYTSDTGKNCDFNTADTLNTLLFNGMFASGQLKEG